MLSPYRQILRKPGALAFSSAGALSRLPGTMTTLSLVLLISGTYQTYSLAGQVSAVYVIAQSICAPQLAKLVDSYGQSRIMRPALVATTIFLSILVLLILNQAPAPLLFVAAAGAGATVGSMGALVRSRWAQVTSSPRELHVAFSLESAIDEFLYAIGPVLATTLATALSPVVGIAVAILATAIGGLGFLAQRRTEPPASGPPQRGTVRQPLALADVFLVALVFVAMGIIFGSTDVATIAYTASQGAPGIAGLLLGVFAVGSLIAGLIYGTRHFTMAAWKRFVIGSIALAASSSLFAVVYGLWLLAGVMLISGFAIAPTIISGNALVQEIVPAERLTEGLTWVGTAIGLGAAIGASLTGAVVDASGAHDGYLVVVGAGVAATLISLSTVPLLRRRYRNQQG